MTYVPPIYRATDLIFHIIYNIFMSNSPLNMSTYLCIEIDHLDPKMR